MLDIRSHRSVEGKKTKQRAKNSSVVKLLRGVGKYDSRCWKNNECHAKVKPQGGHENELLKRKSNLTAAVKLELKKSIIQRFSVSLHTTRQLSLKSVVPAPQQLDCNFCLGCEKFLKDRLLIPRACTRKMSWKCTGNKIHLMQGRFQWLLFGMDSGYSKPIISE